MVEPDIKCCTLICINQITQSIAGPSIEGRKKSPPIRRAILVWANQSSRNYFETPPKNSTTSQTRVQHFLKIEKKKFSDFYFLTFFICTELYIRVYMCIGFEFPGNEEKPKINFEP